MLIVDCTGSQVATEKVARIVLNGDDNTSHTPRAKLSKGKHRRQWKW